MQFILIFVALAIVGSRAEVAIVEQLQTSFKDLPASLRSVEGAEKVLDSISDFFSGMWDGITITFNSDLLLFDTCKLGAQKSLGDFSRFWTFLAEWWFHPEFMVMVDYLIEFGGDILSNLLPCYIPFAYVSNTFGLLRDLTWKNFRSKLITTIILNSDLLYMCGIEMAVCLHQGKMPCAGENLGKITYALLLH